MELALATSFFLHNSHICYIQYILVFQNASPIFNSELSLKTSKTHFNASTLVSSFHHVKSRPCHAHAAIVTISSRNESFSVRHQDDAFVHMHASIFRSMQYLFNCVSHVEGDKKRFRKSKSYLKRLMKSLRFS